MDSQSFPIGKPIELQWRMQCLKMLIRALSTSGAWCNWNTMYDCKSKKVTIKWQNWWWIFERQMIKQCREWWQPCHGEASKEVGKRWAKIGKNPKYSNQPAASNPSSNNNATKLILVEHNAMWHNWSMTQNNAMQWRPTQNNMMEHNELKWSTMWWNAVETNTKNAVEHNAMQCNGAQHDAMQWGTMWCNPVEHVATQCNAMQCNAMQCNAMQCNAMQCNAMQCNAMRNAMQCNAMRKWETMRRNCKQCSIHPPAIAMLVTATAQQQNQ